MGGGGSGRRLCLSPEGLLGRPGAAGSIRRNLPLLIPLWNLFDAWPVLRDGEAARVSDRITGIRVRRAA